MKLQALLVSFELIAATIPPAIHEPIEIQVKNVNLRLDDEIVLNLSPFLRQPVSRNSSCNS